MSCGEQGLGGIWSCLYCESTGLTQDQAAQLPVQPLPEDTCLSNSTCSCESTHFRSVAVEATQGAQCEKCLALLLSKDALQNAAPPLLPSTLNGESTAEKLVKGAAADVAAGSAIALLFSLF